MTSDVTLRLLLTSVDKSASRGLSSVGREAGQAGGKLGRMGGLGKAAALGVAGALAGAGLAALDFGKDSLAAFADAEASQNKLEDAYARYPALANVNIAALRKYNQELQRKTGADADDLASSQATLAAFKLTGKQIKDTTPLLVDYANKTGKTLPEAAKLLGKATLGNTRALKDLGISYKSTGDPAKDYANIMKLLEEKVGGYTDSLPEAEKKSKILAASFSDLQESVGAKLQPAMIALTDAGQGVLDWLDENPEVAEGAAAAFDLLGGALKGIWDVVRKFVAPAIAWLLDGFASATRGLGTMLEALGTIPGFEWARDAAEKVNETADAIGTVADGLRSLADEPAPEIKVEDEATDQVKQIDTRIRSLKGKIVEAKAKGDTKEVDRLRAKIGALRGKKLDINAAVRKTGITYLKLKDIGVGGGLRISAYAKGGRPRVGELAMFHADEMWVPDTAGTVLTKSRTRSLIGPGPAPLSAAPRGGDTYNIDVRGVLSESQAGREIDKVLTRLKRSRSGRRLGFES